MAITQMSNVLGCVNDIKGIASLCHKKGIVLVADGAQSVPHMPVNVSELDVDFLSFSGHKMLARWESARCTASWSGWKNASFPDRR